MIATQQIEKAQEDKGWKTAEDIPLWQAHYNDYGGYDKYIEIRDLYWSLSDYYLHDDVHRSPGERYEATNFPLVKGNAEFNELLLKFRRDLKVELYIPKKYDIYKEKNY